MKRATDCKPWPVCFGCRRTFVPLLSYPRETVYVNNVPQGVNKVCGEGGDSYPVLIHTGLLDHLPPPYPRSGLLETRDEATSTLLMFHFSPLLLLLRFINLIRQ